MLSEVTVEFSGNLCVYPRSHHVIERYFQQNGFDAAIKKGLDGIPGLPVGKVRFRLSQFQFPVSLLTYLFFLVAETNSCAAGRHRAMPLSARPLNRTKHVLQHSLRTLLSSQYPAPCSIFLFSTS
jgi:hypothetical protein